MQAPQAPVEQEHHLQLVPVALVRRSVTQMAQLQLQRCLWYPW